MRRFLGNPRILVGGFAIIVLFLTAVLAPVLAPFDPYKLNPAKSLRSPGQTYLLGTDDLGRDIFSRLSISLTTFGRC